MASATGSPAASKARTARSASRTGSELRVEAAGDRLRRLTSGEVGRHGEPGPEGGGQRRGRTAAIEVGERGAGDLPPDGEAGALVAQQPAEAVGHGDLPAALDADRGRAGPADERVPVGQVRPRAERREQVAGEHRPSGQPAGGEPLGQRVTVRRRAGAGDREQHHLHRAGGDPGRRQCRVGAADERGRRDLGPGGDRVAAAPTGDAEAPAVGVDHDRAGAGAPCVNGQNDSHRYLFVIEVML